MIHERVANEKLSLICSIFSVFEIVVVKGEFDKKKYKQKFRFLSLKLSNSPLTTTTLNKKKISVKICRRQLFLVSSLIRAINQF